MCRLFSLSADTGDQSWLKPSHMGTRRKTNRQEHDALLASEKRPCNGIKPAWEKLQFGGICPGASAQLLMNSTLIKPKVLQRSQMVSQLFTGELWKWGIGTSKLSFCERRSGNASDPFMKPVGSCLSVFGEVQVWIHLHTPQSELDHLSPLQSEGRLCCAAAGNTSAPTVLIISFAQMIMSPAWMSGCNVNIVETWCGSMWFQSISSGFSCRRHLCLVAPSLLELCDFVFKALGKCFHETFFLRLKGLRTSMGAKRCSEWKACRHHASTGNVTLIKGDKATLEARQTDAGDSRRILHRSPEPADRCDYAGWKLVTIPLQDHDWQ